MHERKQQRETQENRPCTPLPTPTMEGKKGCLSGTSSPPMKMFSLLPQWKGSLDSSRVNSPSMSSSLSAAVEAVEFSWRVGIGDLVGLLSGSGQHMPKTCTKVGGRCVRIPLFIGFKSRSGIIERLKRNSGSGSSAEIITLRSHKQWS